LGHGDYPPPSRDQQIERECRLLCELVLIPLWWCRSDDQAIIRSVIGAFKPCFGGIIPTPTARFDQSSMSKVDEYFSEIHKSVVECERRLGRADAAQHINRYLQSHGSPHIGHGFECVQQWCEFAMGAVRERQQILWHQVAGLLPSAEANFGDQQRADQLKAFLCKFESGGDESVGPVRCQTFPQPPGETCRQDEFGGGPRISSDDMRLAQGPHGSRETPRPTPHQSQKPDRHVNDKPSERPPVLSASPGASAPLPRRPAPDRVAPPARKVDTSVVSFDFSELDRFARAADDIRMKHDAQTLLKLIERVSALQASRPHALEEVRWPTVTDDPGVWVLSSASLTAKFDVWFAGDIHGDLAALEAIVAHALSRTAPGKLPCVILLGDLCDDGPHNHEVVVRVLELMLDDRLRLCLIRGNHDEALSFDEASSTFRSTVDPAQYCEWLNRQPPGSAEHEVARCMIKVWDAAPRAVFVHHPEGGLLAVHGGVPHTDLHDTIRACYRDGQAPFSSPRCHLDFVWLRMHSRAKKRLPNRLSKTCELGIEDVIGFCHLVQEMLGFPVSTIIRGHDHVEERYEVLAKYEPLRVVTINSMSRRLEREASTGGTDLRTPCIARWKPGAPLEIVRLALHGSAGVTLLPGVGGTP
jgi:hypothetical protein